MQKGETMDEYIERQAAIEAIHEDADWLAAQGSDWQAERMERDKSILKSLPSAEPERKKGTWEPMFNGQFKGGQYWFSCSKCNRIVPEVRNGGWNYCPNCGAKMEG